MRSPLPLIIAAVSFVLLLVVGNMCVATVDAGRVGVLKTFGQVQDKELGEGLHFKAPWQNVVTMETRLRAHHSKANSASSDLQIVSAEVTIQYSLTSAMAGRIYQKMGSLEQIEVNVLSPAIQESLKSVTARYTAEQLITSRQAVKTEVEKQIDQFISTTLKDKKVEGAVIIANIAITEFNFSGEFNKAIEAKVMAEQEALKAKNEKTRRITEAEAKFQEEKLKADANAYSIEKESIARADAIRREADALRSNPNLIQLRGVDKWNGQLPTYSGGQMPVPFLQVPGVEPKAESKSGK